MKSDLVVRKKDSPNVFEIDLDKLIQDAIKEMIGDYCRGIGFSGMLRDVMREIAGPLIGQKLQEETRAMDFKPMVTEAIKQYATCLLPGMDFGGSTFEKLIREQLSRIVSKLVKEGKFD